MSEEEKRKELTYDEAVAMLPEGNEIHTIRSGKANESTGVTLGACMSKKHILKLLKNNHPELAGETATKLKHRICCWDDLGPLFIETKSD